MRYTTRASGPRVIGVLDLLNGQAVHARGGMRAGYRPVQEVAGVHIPPGDVMALLQAYSRLGVQEVYVADLDAILHRAPRYDLAASIAGQGFPVWLDAGISGAVPARQVLALGVRRVVVGLETLTSFDALGEIGSALGGDATAFSLDLRDGTPVTVPGAAHRGASPEDLAERAAAAGAGAIIVLDLARIGSGLGVDVPLLARIRRRAPGVALVAGGGVRDSDDLAALADAGCDAALVATALLAGRIGRRSGGNRV